MFEKTFAVAFVDMDGELTLLKMPGSSNAEAARDFLYRQFPESEVELTGLNTFEELASWCESIDCQVDVIAVA